MRTSWATFRRYIEGRDEARVAGRNWAVNVTPERAHRRVAAILRAFNGFGEVTCTWLEARTCGTTSDRVMSAPSDHAKTEAHGNVPQPEHCGLLHTTHFLRPPPVQPCPHLILSREPSYCHKTQQLWRWKQTRSRICSATSATRHRRSCRTTSSTSRTTGSGSYGTS
jgi:hypothetical protein